MNTVQRFLLIAVSSVYIFSSSAEQKRCPELNSVEAHNNLINKNECAVIIYYAPWCSACKAMDKPVESAAREYYNVRFAKANLDKSNMKQLLGKLRVKAYPTTIAYRNGKEMRREEGSLSPQEINQIAQQVQTKQPAPTPVPTPKPSKPAQAKQPVAQAARPVRPKRQQ